MSIILPTVGASEWKEEAERVGPVLQAAARASRETKSGWASHVDMLKQYTRGALPDDPDNNRAGVDADLSSAALVDMMSVLQRTLLEEVSGIMRGESLINSNPSLEKIAINYAGIKEV
jgi:hypothetical protein